MRLRGLDDRAAERLLEGRSPAPPGYEPVAGLLADLRERPEPAPADDSVVTHMQALVEQGLAASGRPRADRRRLALVGAVAAGALGVLGGLGAAGALPDPVQRPVSDVLATLGIDAPSPPDGTGPSPADGGVPTDADPLFPASGVTPAIPADPGAPGDGATPAIPAPPSAGELPPQAGGSPAATAPVPVAPGPDDHAGDHPAPGGAPGVE